MCVNRTVGTLCFPIPGNAFLNSFTNTGNLVSIAHCRDEKTKARDVNDSSKVTAAAKSLQSCPTLCALAPHERLPEILVVPREKTPTGAAARGNP